MASALKMGPQKQKPGPDFGNTLRSRGFAAAMGGRAVDAAKLVEQALHIALEHHLPEQTALAYRRRATIRVWLRGRDRNEVAAHREAISIAAPWVKKAVSYPAWPVCPTRTSGSVNGRKPPGSHPAF